MRHDTWWSKLKNGLQNDDQSLNIQLFLSVEFFCTQDGGNEGFGEKEFYLQIIWISCWIFYNFSFTWQDHTRNIVILNCGKNYLTHYFINNTCDSNKHVLIRNIYSNLHFSFNIIFTFAWKSNFFNITSIYKLASFP